MKTEEKWGMALALMAEIYGRELTPGVLKTYYSIFNKKGFTVEQVQKAVEYLLETRKYSNMPTPAEFIEAIRGKIESKADEQAAIALNAVRGNDVEFTDPITKHLMSSRWRLGNLRNTMLEKDEPFFIKEFKTLYINFNDSAFSKTLIGSDNKQIESIVSKIADKK